MLQKHHPKNPVFKLTDLQALINDDGCDAKLLCLVINS